MENILNTNDQNNNNNINESLTIKKKKYIFC